MFLTFIHLFIYYFHIYFVHFLLLSMNILSIMLWKGHRKTQVFFFLTFLTLTQRLHRKISHHGEILDLMKDTELCHPIWKSPVLCGYLIFNLNELKWNQFNDLIPQSHWLYSKAQKICVVSGYCIGQCRYRSFQLL